MCNSDVAEKFIQDMIDIQRQQQRHSEQLIHMQQYRDQQLQQLLRQHQQLTLPHAEVKIFDGDPVHYCSFIRSFENLIKAKTKNSSTSCTTYCSILSAMFKNPCEGASR